MTREGSRRATCVYTGASGTGSPPCRAPCVLFGSGRPLLGTTLVASGASQSTPGSLCQNSRFKVEAAKAAMCSTSHFKHLHSGYIEIIMYK